MNDKLSKRRHCIDYETALRDYCMISDHFSKQWDEYYINARFCKNRKRKVRSRNRLIRYFFIRLGINLKNSKYDRTFIHECETEWSN